MLVFVYTHKQHRGGLGGGSAVPAAVVKRIFYIGTCLTRGPTPSVALGESGWISYIQRVLLGNQAKHSKPVSVNHCTLSI